MDNKTVTMAHGAGGRQTSELISLQMMRQFLFRRPEKWLCQQTDLLYRRHFFQGEISVNFLSAELSMILHVWERSQCISPVHS